jgi:hypothetical protein
VSGCPDEHSYAVTLSFDRKDPIATAPRQVATGKCAWDIVTVRNGKLITIASDVGELDTSSLAEQADGTLWTISDHRYLRIRGNHAVALNPYNLGFTVQAIVNDADGRVFSIESPPWNARPQPQAQRMVDLQTGNSFPIPQSGSFFVGGNGQAYFVGIISGKYAIFRASSQGPEEVQATAEGDTTITTDGSTWSVVGERLGLIDAQGNVVRTIGPFEPLPCEGWSTTNIPRPGGLLAGPDGSLWFSFFTLWRFSQQSGLEQACRPRIGMASEPVIARDGSVWYMGYTALIHFTLK